MIWEFKLAHQQFVPECKAKLANSYQSINTAKSQIITNFSSFVYIIDIKTVLLAVVEGNIMRYTS